MEEFIQEDDEDAPAPGFDDEAGAGSDGDGERDGDGLLVTDYREPVSWGVVGRGGRGGGASGPQELQERGGRCRDCESHVQYRIQPGKKRNAAGQHRVSWHVERTVALPRVQRWEHAPRRQLGGQHGRSPPSGRHGEAAGALRACVRLDTLGCSSLSLIHALCRCGVRVRLGATAELQLPGGLCCRRLPRYRIDVITHARPQAGEPYHT